MNGSSIASMVSRQICEDRSICLSAQESDARPLFSLRFEIGMSWLDGSEDAVWRVKTGGCRRLWLWMMLAVLGQVCSDPYMWRLLETVRYVRAICQLPAVSFSEVWLQSSHWYSFVRHGHITGAPYIEQCFVAHFCRAPVSTGVLSANHALAPMMYLYHLMYSYLILFTFFVVFSF